MSDKDVLRQIMRSRLRELPLLNEADVRGLNLGLSSLLKNVQANVLCGYMAMGHEPDIAGFMQSWLDSGRDLLLPRFMTGTGQYEMVCVPALNEEFIKPGKYGIFEPVCSLKATDLSHRNISCVWLVPGLAFSEFGTRLGRGGGYYDRLMADDSGLKVGIARDEQLLADIPEDAHDVTMDYIVTPTRTLLCRR